MRDITAIQETTMLTILADMLMTASGQEHLETNRYGKPRHSDHWAGRFDAKKDADATRPSYRFNRFRDLW
jgi:hypothetical protein